MKEIRQSNITALRKALEHPTADIEEAIHQLEVKYKDSPSEVLDEPDLMNYCAIDMAALKDVRSTGAEYALSLEALMQADYGPTPGYLPETDARNLLVGVSIVPHRAIALFIWWCCPLRKVSFHPHVFFLLILGDTSTYAWKPVGKEGLRG